MSLARQLMSGVTLEGIEINPNRYTHDEGAFNIAIESAAELHEIFKESFYDMEQIELAAIHEGIAIEGSQYQPLMEAKNGSVFEKIKTFFLKLKEKVKSFFHSIKRHLDSVFKSGQDFAKRYESEIRDLSFKDYKIKIFEYDDTAIDNLNLDACVKKAEEMINNVDKDADEIVSKISKSGDSAEAIGHLKNQYKDDDNEFKELKYDRDESYKIYTQTIAGKAFDDESDYSKWIFAHFRKGAESASEITEREIDDNELRNMMSTLLKSTTGSKIDTVSSKVSDIYNKAIKSVNAAKKKIEDIKAEGDDSKYTSKVATVYRDLSSSLALSQTIMNKYISGWKTAVTSRDSDYKKVISGAFSYAKKYNKNNK